MYNNTVVQTLPLYKRVVEAAARITREGIAKIVLIGNEAECKKVAPDVDLTGITLIDPLTSDIIMKQLETVLMPGAVFTTCKPGRSVFAVEWQAPET